MVTVVRHATSVGRHGVVLGLYPGDPNFWMEVERAPDLAGNPDLVNAEVRGRIEPSQRHFVDETGAQNLFYHYRGYHVGEGYDDGDPTAWIRVKPTAIPDRIPIELLPPKPRFDVDLVLDDATGAVDIVMDSELFNGSAKWASSTVTWPAEGVGTLVALDGSGDAEVPTAFLLAAGETGYVRVSFYEGPAGTTLVGSLRISTTRISAALPNTANPMQDVVADFVDGRIVVRWRTSLFPPGARIIIKDDPSDTTDSAWNILSDSAKETKWTAGIELGREVTGQWISDESALTQRTYSLMLRQEALGGAVGAIYHVLLTDPAPNAGASPWSVRHENRTVTVVIDDFKLLNATRVRVHASETNGFAPSEATVKTQNHLGGLLLYAMIKYGLTKKWAMTFQIPATVPLNGQSYYVKLEAWDSLSDILNEASSYSGQATIALGRIPDEDVQLPNDAGNLDGFNVWFTGGRLKAELERNSKTPGQAITIRRDPSNTTAAGWAVLSEASKLTKWNAGIELAHTVANIWEAAEEFVTQRVYSLMARTITMDGVTLGASILHGYVNDPVPEPLQAIITIKSTGREISLLVSNLELVNCSALVLRASTTNGFVPSTTNTIAEVNIDTLRFSGGLLHKNFDGTYEFKYRADDALAFGSTVYFKIQTHDHLTAVLGEAAPQTPQFAHVLSQQPAETIVSFEVGVPNGTLTPTGIGLTANSNGSTDYQLQWNYAHGSRKADVIVLFAVSSLSAPTILDDAILVSAEPGTGKHYTYKNIDASKFWSFGIAMGRRTANGVEISTILAPLAGPDWRGITPGGNDFTDTIEGTPAATVEGGAARANTGLDAGGNLTADISGDTNILGTGRLYVPTGGGIPVGQIGSPSSRTKTITVQASEIVPAGNLETFFVSGDYVGPNAINAQANFAMPITLAPGSTITQVQADHYREDTSALATVVVEYTSSPGGTPVALVTLTHSTTGWQVQTGSLSHTVVDGRRYYARISLRSSTTLAGARLADIKLTYTVPNYETGI